MSSPSDQRFECRWHASRLLVAAYLLTWLIAVVSLLVLPVPLWLVALALLLCLAHAAWVLPSQVLLCSKGAWRGLRHDAQGWALWSRAAGWQPVQLRRDSLALPLAVVIRFTLPGQRFARGLCLPCDSMPRELHRKLRLRLKFSRRRWAAPE